MKLKYRIIKHNFPITNNIYIAQYKVLGLWMNINDRQIGRFLTPTTCYCESHEESSKRIDLHNLNMKRAGEWWDKETIITRNV